MVPRTKVQHGPLHRADLLLASFRPALRPERLNILAERLFVAMHGPGADADDGAGGEVFAADLGAAGGDDAFEDEAGGRVHTEVFLDAGVQVGEVLLGEVEVDVAGQGGEVSGGEAGGEFVLEFGVDGGVFEDVVEEGGQGDGAVG